MRLILRFDYEQCALRNMSNTQGHIPQHLCGSLKAQLLYEEEWYPEEVEYDEQAEEAPQDMIQPPQDAEQPAEGTVE